MIQTIECITSDSLKTALDAGENFCVVDVRTEAEFKNGHIIGAIHIPLAEIARNLRGLDADKIYVTVCGKGGGRSESAAAEMRKAGFHAWSLCCGMAGWDHS